MGVDFTEKIIQEVRNRPILYLLNHQDYKNKMKKLQAWKEIQREFNEEVCDLFIISNNSLYYMYIFIYLFIR